MLNFLRKIPSAFLAWYSIIVFSATIATSIGISSDSTVYFLLTFVFPIVAAILLHRKTFPQKPLYQKWWFWAICAMIATIIIVYNAEPSQSPSTPDSTIASTAETNSPSLSSTATTTYTEPVETTAYIETTAPTQPESKFLSDFCQASGCNSSAAEYLYNLLHVDLGFEDIEFIGKNAVGQINWDISADRYVLMVTADNDGVYRIICGSFTLYENSNVALAKNDLENRSISEYRSYYYVIAKDIVSSSLKSPSSARFSSMDECSMQRNGDIVAVQGYVDAKNPYGVELINKFIVEFKITDISSFSYITLYIQIGDQTAGEFINLD